MLTSTTTIPLDPIFGHFAPTAEVSTKQWMLDTARMPDGAPFDAEKFPHQFAPGGILEALDDGRYQEFALQWATRLGKTSVGELYLLKRADTDPCPMLFATGTRDLVKRNTETKIYPQMEHIERLAAQLMPKHKRQAFRIDLEACRIFCGWSGSDATLADLSAKVILCSEVDKWDTATSREADPVRLAAQRAKEFPDRQIIYESTPSIKGRSRIERMVEASTNSRFWVPCPKCGKFQTLALSKGDDPRTEGGLIWDRDTDGTSNPDVANKTARYCCQHCLYEIYDDLRPQMMQSGVWAAHGQTVQRGGRVRGPEPDTRRYGSQLSSLYSLAMDWGDMAYRFLTSKDRPREFQDFVNGDLGETFEVVAHTTDADDLAERCCLEYPKGTVPDGAVFMTAAIDRQALERKVWMVCGWGSDCRGWVIDYGELTDDTELENRTVRYSVSRMQPVLTLYDSGFEKDSVYRWCDRLKDAGWPIAPLKGVATQNTDKPYTVSFRDDNTKLKQRPLVLSVTNYWQEVIQAALDRHDPEDFGGIAFPREAASDGDFLDQLLNEAPQSVIDTRNYAKLLWVKRSEHLPNDYRDLLRYNRLAAEIWTRGNWKRARGSEGGQDQPSSGTMASQQTRFKRGKIRGLSGRRF